MERTLEEEIAHYENIHKKKIQDFSKADWEALTQQNDLSVQFVRKFVRHIDWYSLSFKKLSEAFIDEFESNLIWSRISVSQEMSIDFVNKHKDKINWRFFSTNNYLNEEMILAFKDNWRWELLMFSNGKCLTYNTLLECIEYVKPSYLDKYRLSQLTDSELNQLKEILNLKTHFA